MTSATLLSFKTPTALWLIEGQEEHHGALSSLWDEMDCLTLHHATRDLSRFFIAHLFIQYGLLKHAASQLKTIHHSLTPLSPDEGVYLLNIANLDQWNPVRCVQPRVTVPFSSTLTTNGSRG